jgi:hypothetical protein
MMSRLLECPICINPYDLRECRPFVTSCGHSICWKCSVSMFGHHRKRPCPVCNTIIYPPLADNIESMYIIEGNSGISVDRPLSPLRTSPALGQDASKWQVELNLLSMIGYTDVEYLLPLLELYLREPISVIGLSSPRPELMRDLTRVLASRSNPPSPFLSLYTTVRSSSSHSIHNSIYLFFYSNSPFISAL